MLNLIASDSHLKAKTFHMPVSRVFIYTAYRSIQIRIVLAVSFELTLPGEPLKVL
jgi:hypothetical protein